jgi:hypothetical protein
MTTAFSAPPASLQSLALDSERFSQRRIRLQYCLRKQQSARDAAPSLHLNYFVLPRRERA